MADVREKVEQIRQAVYGKEVRESIASGIEAINAEVESTTQRQAAVEEAEVEREAAEAIRQENEEDRVEEHALRLAEVNAIKDAYDAAEKANLSVEVSNARTSTVKSKTFGTLKERLEESEQEAAAHMADVVTDVDGAHGLKIEEGEWTPDMNSNPTITVQQGYYYKIGKKVTVWGNLEYSAKGTDPGEQLYIKGLPFATGNPVYDGQIPNFRGTSIIIDSASRITGFVNYNVIYLGEVLSTGAVSALNFGEINNSGSIYFTVTYLTN